MSVIEFPGRQPVATPELRELSSLADLVPSDDALDARAAELMPLASDTLQRFLPGAIAEMLAYAAARLERVGFQIFMPERTVDEREF